MFGLQIYEDLVDGVIERVSDESELNLPDLRTHIRKKFNHAQAAQGKDLSLVVICWAITCCFVQSCNVLAVSCCLKATLLTFMMCFIVQVSFSAMTAQE